MYKQKQSSNLSIKFYSIVAVVIFILGLIAVLSATGTIHLFKTGSRTADSQDAQYQSTKKAATAEGNGNPASTDSKGSPQTNSGTYTAPSNSDNIHITAVQDGSNVIVTTKLKGYSDGSCDLNISKDSLSISRTATVVYAPEFATCSGYTIPVASLGSGMWVLNLDVTSGGIKTTSNTTLQVK